MVGLLVCWLAGWLAGWFACLLWAARCFFSFGLLALTGRRELPPLKNTLPGDLIQNIGVALAGLLIWWDPTWKIADPICTWIFAIIVMVTTFSSLWGNISVLLEGVPDGHDVDVIKAKLLAVKDPVTGKPLVTDVHDLHVWSMASGGLAAWLAE